MVTSLVVTLTPEQGMAPISKGLVRESLNRKVLPNNADTSIFNRKPQLYTIIHSLQLSYIPSHSCFTASAGRPSARRPLARRLALPLALGQHWPNISSHVCHTVNQIHYYWRWDNIGPTYLYLSNLVP